MLILVAAMATGCLPAATCPETSIALAATVSADAMDPSSLTACRGQDVTLEITSETDGILHIHGYDEQVPATPLEPGEERTLEFTADVAGQFVIELHARDGETETEIGILTVNEP
jgi:hypothetical protein